MTIGRSRLLIGGGAAAAGLGAASWLGWRLGWGWSALAHQFARWGNGLRQDRCAGVATGDH